MSEATPPIGGIRAAGTILNVSKNRVNPPPLKEATFRMPRVAVVAAFLAMISGTPFAWSSWWLATVYLLPIGFSVWVLRTQTAVNADGLTARRVFDKRVIAWKELTGLSVVSDSKVRAVLTSKEQVDLPGVRARHLPLLAALSGGRIPDFTAAKKDTESAEETNGTPQSSAG